MQELDTLYLVWLYFKNMMKENIKFEILKVASSSGLVMLLTSRICFKNNEVMFLLIILTYDETFFERPTWYPEGGHLMEV